MNVLMNGLTPLEVASENGNIDAVKLLLAIQIIDKNNIEKVKVHSK